MEGVAKLGVLMRLRGEQFAERLEVESSKEEDLVSFSGVFSPSVSVSVSSWSFGSSSEPSESLSRLLSDTIGRKHTERGCWIQHALESRSSQSSQEHLPF